MRTGWQNQHEPECAVNEERAKLVSELVERINKGYQVQSLIGAVREYDKGGDQEHDACDCGYFDPRYATIRLRKFNSATILGVRVVAINPDGVLWEDPDEMPMEGEQPGPNGGRIHRALWRNIAWLALHTEEESQ